MITKYDFLNSFGQSACPMGIVRIVNSSEMGIKNMFLLNIVFIIFCGLSSSLLFLSLLYLVDACQITTLLGKS